MSKANAENFSSLAAFIWSVADTLRGDFKQSEYGRVILPFTVLRRLECVLEPTRDAVVEEKKKHKGSKIPVAPYLDGCSQFCLKLADIRIHVNTPISQAQDRLSGDLEEGNKSIRSIAEVTFLRSDFKMFDIISLVCKLEV